MVAVSATPQKQKVKTPKSKVKTPKAEKGETTADVMEPEVNTPAKSPKIEKTETPAKTPKSVEEVEGLVKTPKSMKKKGQVKNTPKVLKMIKAEGLNGVTAENAMESAETVITASSQKEEEAPQDDSLNDTNGTSTISVLEGEQEKKSKRKMNESEMTPEQKKRKKEKQKERRKRWQAKKRCERVGSAINPSAFNLKINRGPISLISPEIKTVLGILSKAEQVTGGRDYYVEFLSEEAMKEAKTKLQKLSYSSNISITPAIQKPRQEDQGGRFLYAVGLLDTVKVKDLENVFQSSKGCSIYHLDKFGPNLRIGKVRFDTPEEAKQNLPENGIMICGKKVYVVPSKGGIKRAFKIKEAEDAKELYGKKATDEEMETEEIIEESKETSPPKKKDTKKKKVVAEEKEEEDEEEEDDDDDEDDDEDDDDDDEEDD